MVFDDFVPKITGHVFRKRNPGGRITPYTVTDYDITYIIKGSAGYTINGIPHDVESGSLLFLGEGDMVGAMTFPQNQMQCFETSFASNYPLVKKIGRGGGELFPPINHIGLRHDIIDLFRDLTICWMEKQNNYLMKCNALLMLILHRLLEVIIYGADSVPGDYRVNKVIHYISMHYAEKLTVKNLAAQVHLDSNYFGRLFRQETGVMIHRYINQIRIQKAELMLQSGSYKVHEAAEHCGFSDVFHFYKQFRALRGFPPSRCIPRNTA